MKRNKLGIPIDEIPYVNYLIGHSIVKLNYSMFRQHTFERTLMQKNKPVEKFGISINKYLK